MPNITRNLREFGQIISGNRRANTELSESMCIAIITAVSCGKSKSEVARIFNVNRKTVQRICDRFYLQNNAKSRPRSGCPIKYSDQIKRYIYLLVYRYLCWSWAALLDYIPNGLSKLTIRRILCIFKIKKWKSKKRILLKPFNTLRRR